MIKMMEGDLGVFDVWLGLNWMTLRTKEFYNRKSNYFRR
jgi:hypothetical protein